ncbi:MAG: FumA C-terminus/TtdB family hydratase beta subunit [Candidatus Firestonebacteria bacterium]
MRQVFLPITEKVIFSLKAGEQVLLSGKLITGRDQVHLRFTEALKKRRKLPVTIKGQTIYYVGPSPAKPGEIIGACGPTTGRRMDAFSPLLIKNGLKAMIGKGGRGEEVVAAIKRFKGIYFISVGGAGAYLAKRVKSSEVIAYPELGPEAVFQLTVFDFPVIVAIDCEGRSIFN